MAAMALDISRLKDYTVFAYMAILLLLLYTRFAGRVVNGARSWIGVGGIRNSARGVREDNHHTISRPLPGPFGPVQQFSSASSPAWASPIPVFAVLSQPDFGSALVFFRYSSSCCMWAA